MAKRTAARKTGTKRKARRELIDRSEAWGAVSAAGAMTKKTPEDIVAKIAEHGRLGRQAWQTGDLVTAEEQFMAAWKLVPEPKTAHDYGQILSRGVVTFCRDTNQFDKAKKWLDVMREAYGSQANPSVEFLAATVHYEAGELDEAFKVFDRLYKDSGQRPFQGVKPDYLKFYKRRASELKLSL